VVQNVNLHVVSLPVHSVFSWYSYVELYWLEMLLLTIVEVEDEFAFFDLSQETGQTKLVSGCGEVHVTIAINLHFVCHFDIFCIEINWTLLFAVSAELSVRVEVGPVPSLVPIAVDLVIFNHLTGRDQ